MLNYEDCKEKVKNLNIKTAKSYSKTIKELRKTDISYKYVILAPDIVFRNNGWVSWNDYLNNGNICNTKKFKDKDKYKFEELRNIAHQQNFTSNIQWKKFAKENNYPVKVNILYINNGWVCWADFLNHSKFKNIIYYSYEDSKQYLNNLKLKNSKEYKKYIKENKAYFLPQDPRNNYLDKWLSWEIYLGYDIYSSDSSAIISIENFLMENNINYIREKRFEYFKKYSFDIFIPSINLIIEYDGIQHYENTSIFKECIENVRKRDNTKNKWCEEQNINLERIPYYEKDLETYMSNILLKYNIHININREYFTFNECKEYLKDFNINNMCIWYEHFKNSTIDSRIPFKPYKKFKNEWISWENFFSNILIKNSKFLPFDDAKKYLRDNNINNYKNWKDFLKNKPSFIPHYPKKIYKNEFKGYIDWFS